jgi:predicted nicotinamide N-methyase
MSFLDAFRMEHDPETVEVPVGGRRYRLFTPRAIERFLDPENPLKGFPLWAKIWPAAMVLAEWIAGQPVDDRRSLIEIGAGLGLVSIVGADRGHRITLSEHDTHALEFARASARLNGCPDLPVIRLDWNRPWQAPGFDLILGSELVYRPEDIAPLLSLFGRLLRPGGTVVLAGETRGTTAAFLRQVQTRFAIRLIAEEPGVPGVTKPVRLHELTLSA